jgi:hypothetical protein
MTLTLTGVEEVVLFIINSYKSKYLPFWPFNNADTYLCLLTFAVRGSLSTVVEAADDTMTFLNSTLSTIERNILADVASAQNAVSTAVNGVIGGISGALGLSTSNLPTITVPSAAQLLNITIPSTVTIALQNLNNSIPTFEQVKNATDLAVQFPFDLLKVWHGCLSEVNCSGRYPFSVGQFHIQFFFAPGSTSERSTTL